MLRALLLVVTVVSGLAAALLLTLSPRGATTAPSRRPARASSLASQQDRGRVRRAPGTRLGTSRPASRSSAAKDAYDRQEATERNIGRAGRRPGAAGSCAGRLRRPPLHVVAGGRRRGPAVPGRRRGTLLHTHDPASRRGARADRPSRRSRRRRPAPMRGASYPRGSGDRPSPGWRLEPFCPRRSAPRSSTTEPVRRRVPGIGWRPVSGTPPGERLRAPRWSNHPARASTVVPRPRGVTTAGGRRA